MEQNLSHHKYSNKARATIYNFSASTRERVECYARPTKFSVMTLDGRMFYSASAAAIRQLSELLLKEIR
jgi:hypothetical protein